MHPLAWLVIVNHGYRFIPSTGLYPRPPRGIHPSSTPATVATGETGYNHPAEGHDAADDGHDHGADGVDDAHEAGSDGVEDACDLFFVSLL